MDYLLFMQRRKAAKSQSRKVFTYPEIFFAALRPGAFA
jgi:hypothetical protein